MSVVDRWLGPPSLPRWKLGAATSATSATTLGDAYVSGENHVADGLLHAATFPPSPSDVAGCSKGAATRNTAVFCGSQGHVADVANVAGGDFQKPQEPDAPSRDASTGSIFSDKITDWRHLYDERAAIREYNGHYSRAEAERLAWGELQYRWHLQHGDRVPRDLCAGCRRPIGLAAALDLIDGNRVHLDERWRATATRALVALGLVPPSSEPCRPLPEFPDPTNAREPK